MSPLSRCALYMTSSSIPCICLTAMTSLLFVDVKCLFVVLYVMPNLLPFVTACSFLFGHL